jgi:mono/diheme cytochrome c family protein
MDCHTLDPEQPAPTADDDGGGIPVLTGYGGRMWLEHFISDPAKHYGEKNQMPAYAERLSERELDLLTRWMTGEYYPTKIGSEEPAPTSPPASVAAEPKGGEADPM